MPFLYLLLRDAVPMGEMERIIGIMEDAYVRGATAFRFSDVHLAGRARYCEARLKALEEIQTMETVAASTKKFKLVRPGTDEDVLGGAVTEDNVYVKTYGSRLTGEKSVAELEVGEGSLHRYALSGQKATVYMIVRVE